ncbi:MAG: hypothetical protein PUC23_04885 [bacterium]|nr:hypothetical protein [bacterium]
MKTLLYFEEYESNLSHELLNRKDIMPIIIRTNKNMKFFNESYLESTKKILNYVIDYYNDIDDEVSKFSKWLEDNDIKIDYFLNDSEYYLEFSNKFARKLGLYALSDEQICWVRDKVDMKKRFREIGLDTVDFEEINSKEKLKKFFINNGSKRIIFKPRRGMNSIETYMINSLEDIDSLELDIVPGKYMAEVFCYDHEWSIESLVQNGQVLDSYLTYIPNSTIWASISNDLNCHMTVPKIPSYFKFVPKEFIQKIVSGMNLKDGAMTIEVFISDDGNIKASELGWRLPGCQATLNHSYSYGIDIYNLLLDIAIHKKVDLKYQDKIVSVGDLYLPNKEGIIEQITPLEKLMKMDGVIGGELFAKIGEYQKKRRVGNDASGWVQVLGENEFDTLQKMQKIYDIFEIEVSNDIGGKKYVKKL